MNSACFGAGSGHPNGGRGRCLTRCVRWLAWAGAVACAAFPAHAETLELAGGSVLVGVTVVGEDAIDLTIEHPELGTLTFLKSDVVERRADAPVADAAEIAAAVDTDLPTELGTDQATESDPNSAEASATAPASDPDAQPAPASGSKTASTVLAESSPASPAVPEKPESSLPTWLQGFDSSFSLGFSGNTGNTNQESLHAAAKTSRKTDLHETSLTSKYFFSRADGAVTRNEVSVDAKQRWLIPDSAWFYFVSGAYEFDQFESFRHRTSAFAGVGYKFFDDETFELTGNAGLGGTYEFGTVNEFNPEAVFGATAATWNFSKTQSLSGGVSWFPDLDDAGEYRLTSNAEWKIKLHTQNALSLKFGVENDYDSQPEGGDEFNDFKYYGALVVDF